MILYNVTIKLERSIAQEWVSWMHEEHMPELMGTGLFIRARLFHLLEQDETDGITYVAQYSCDSLNHYQRYISEYSASMREKGVARFGNRFIAFRTVMEELLG